MESGREDEAGAARSAEPQLGRPGADGRPAELGLGVPGSGWHSRGYLPHFDRCRTLQSVTFRLADSLPQTKLEALEWEIRGRTPSEIAAERRRMIEQWLDSGMGCCALRHPALAGLMRETLLKWDGDRYRLFAWCVMPNHVHVLMETLSPLSRIVQSWKSFTGRWAMRNNAELGLGIPGKGLWMREYWDRYIRDDAHFEKCGCISSTIRWRRSYARDQATGHGRARGGRNAALHWNAGPQLGIQQQ